jgi:hypothetical protein
MLGLIPDILDNYDFVTKGHEVSYYNPKKKRYEHDGAMGVLISKEYSDGTAVVVNAVPSKGDLMIKTFYIKKEKTAGVDIYSSNYDSATDVLPPGSTSETRANQPRHTK